MGWISENAVVIASRGESELAELVAISSPSGDVPGAEACFELCAGLLPDAATVKRPPCSSTDHAPDLIARLSGTGSKRIVLLGHVDTVIAHPTHRPLSRRGDHLIGSGSVDMKGGVILALGVLRALAERREDFAHTALLLVCDEEWRSEPFSHVPSFAGWDACLCFEAGERSADGDEAVVVRRKAAGTVRIAATGRAAHSGSQPHLGRNALLALARVAELIAEQHDPDGPDHLTAVPTVMHAGEAFNVVPGAGELMLDIRADSEAAIMSTLEKIPSELDGVGLATELIRIWPGMNSSPVAAPLLDRAAAALGRPIVGHGRGGASDASHFASAIELTIDGLGPRGDGAHNPGEFVLASSLKERAAVALAVVEALL